MEDTTPDPFEVDHKRFQGELELSHISVRRMAAWFQDRGYHVWIPPHTVAPTHAEALEHSDGGDLFVNGELYEIKRLTVEWNYVGHGSDLQDGDWPFPSFIVDDAGTYDRKDREPRYYYVLNWSMTHAAIVDMPNVRGWRRGRVWNRKAGFTPHLQDVYLCYLTCLEFIKL
jgi:hypothetical protein